MYQSGVAMADPRYKQMFVEPMNGHVHQVHMWDYFFNLKKKNLIKTASHSLLVFR